MVRFPLWSVECFEVLFRQFMHDYDVMTSDEKKHGHVEPWYLAGKVDLRDNIIPKACFGEMLPQRYFAQIDRGIDRR